MTIHTCSNGGCDNGYYHKHCLDKVWKAVGSKKGRNTGFTCFSCNKGTVIYSSHRPGRKKGKGLLPTDPQPPQTPKKADVRPPAVPLSGVSRQIRVLHKCTAGLSLLTSLDERLHGVKKAVADREIPGMTSQTKGKTKTQERKEKKKQQQNVMRAPPSPDVAQEPCADAEADEVEFLTFLCMTGTVPQTPLAS